MISFKKAAAAAFLAGQVLLPVTAFAAPAAPIDPATPGTFQNTDGSEGFCGRVSALIPAVTARLNERKANLAARRAELSGNRAAVRAAQKGRIDELRAREDGVRSSMTIKLEARAKTSAQKAAVARFKASMDAAVAARRAAMTEARTEFHADLDALIAGWKAQESAFLASYESTVATGLNKAKADCTNRIREDIVRERLRTALPTRAQFQALRSQVIPQDGQARIQALVEERREATQRALEEFRTKAEAARDALKASLGAESGVR